LQEVRDLLQDETAISTKTGLRLALSMLAETYELIQTIDGRLVVVENKSVGVWISKHKEMAIVLAVIFVAIFISDFRQPLIKYVMGLSFLP
jgi:hypothetical protein